MGKHVVKNHMKEPELGLHNRRAEHTYAAAIATRQYSLERQQLQRDASVRAMGGPQISRVSGATLSR